MSPTPSRLAWSSKYAAGCTPRPLRSCNWLLTIVAVMISLAGQATAATRSSITITTKSLPAGVVQSTYIAAAVSVSGGTSPYQFNISHGSLPPGLSLNSSTGSISGVPRAAGSYTFTIRVTDLPLSGSGDRSFTISVTGSTPSITVTVSPTSASLVSGGSKQFSATVSGTPQTAVTWSSTAGSVSSTGLFTAPSVSTATTVTVTATSVAAPGQMASATVSVAPQGSGPGLTVATTSLPVAIKGTVYQASLIATGGQSPYQWSLSSGSLPGGVALSANGSVAGTTTVTGTFNFTVQVQDSAHNTASAALSVQVSAPGGGNCGPPTYNCSRSDVAPAPNPVVPPQVGPNACIAGQLSQCGNLTGINRVITDPDFNNRIVRVTDSTTAGNTTMVTATSGSDDSNTWNHDSTMFLAQDITASAFLFAFNPSTMQATELAPMPYLPGGSGWSWSFVNPNILYRLNGTVILSYDLTGFTGGTVPTPTTVYDFNNPQCLGADPNWTANPSMTWRSQFAISMDDQMFASGYSNAGGQGTGVFTTVYARGQGCRLLDSKSGIIYGQWGQNGTISIPDRWTIHANVLGKSGTWDIVGYTTCLSTSCGGHPYFWDVATTTVNSPSGCLSGHWTEGNTHWMNNSGCTHIGQDTMRLFSAPNTSTSISQAGGYPHNMVLPFDQHFSWNNVDAGDSYPIISGSWTNITNPLPAAWYNEILATFPTNLGTIPAGTVKRFAHSFISGTSHRFNTHYAIGSVSQDGRFFMFASDWMGTLGSEAGGASCTVGKDCRGDVFIVELQ